MSTRRKRPKTHSNHSACRVDTPAHRPVTPGLTKGTLALSVTITQMRVSLRVDIPRATGRGFATAQLYLHLHLSQRSLLRLRRPNEHVALAGLPKIAGNADRNIITTCVAKTSITSAVRPQVVVVVTAEEPTTQYTRIATSAQLPRQRRQQHLHPHPLVGTFPLRARPALLNAPVTT